MLTEPESRGRRLAASSRAGLAVGLAVALGACGGAGPTDEVPMSTVVALVNASAPRDNMISSQFCGGVLVGADVVMTAAHCIDGKDADDVVAVVGAGNLCRTAPITGEPRTVLQIAAIVDRDVALLSLAPGSGQGDAPAVVAADAGEELSAWGWGPESARGPAPCEVTEKRLTEVPLAECASLIPPGAEAREEEFFCAVAQSDSSNTCVGDSGGPVFDSASGGLVGIVLSGTGCSGSDPGLYARASSVRLPTP